MNAPASGPPRRPSGLPLAARAKCPGHDPRTKETMISNIVARCGIWRVGPRARGLSGAAVTMVIPSRRGPTTWLVRVMAQA